MKLHRFISFTLLLLFSLTLLDAQVPVRIPGSIHNKIRKKVREKVHQEAEEKAEEEIEKAIEEAILENEEKKPNSEQNSEVTFEENTDPGDFTPNEFIGSLHMEIIQKKKGKVTKNGASSRNFYIAEFQTAIQTLNPDGSNVIMIVDKRDNTTIMKMDDKGDKVATKMKMPKVTVDMEDTYNEENYKVTKTSDTKTIDGHLCTKYIIDSEETTTTAWITNEVEMDHRTLTSFVNIKGKGGKSMGSSQSNLYGVEGLALESHTTHKNKDESYEMFIKNIVVGTVSKDPFNLDGYQVTDLTQFMKH
ncbi:DUF4412 domain-containing protein [bacterium]|nr:DUF4412 domain-containing protein [bacterium]